LTECQIVSDAPAPIATGLFTWPAAEPRLIASRCSGCGALAFPAQQGCANCAGGASEEVLLGRRGSLWTWTIQRFPPPPPYAGDRENFEPFGVGYVELPEGIRVESRLTVNDPEQLAVGMEMELVIEPFVFAADGRERMSFAFRPVGDRPGRPA
jgi:uncharacterized OB-fold protein